MPRKPQQLHKDAIFSVCRDYFSRKRTGFSAKKCIHIGHDWEICRHFFTIYEDRWHSARTDVALM